MSAEPITYEFFDLPAVLRLLGFDQDDDEDVDLLRGAIGLKADRWVHNRLLPYAASFPLTGELLELAMSAACNRAASKYKRHINNKEMADSYQEDAEEDIKTLIGAFKATPTTRTEIVSSSPDYDTETELFSQTLK